MVATLEDLIMLDEEWDKVKTILSLLEVSIHRYSFRYRQGRSRRLPLR